MATNKRVERQLADMCWRNTRQKKRCTLPAAKTGAAHKTRRAARLQFVVRNAEFMGKNARQRNASPAFFTTWSTATKLPVSATKPSREQGHAILGSSLINEPQSILLLIV